MDTPKVAVWMAWGLGCFVLCIVLGGILDALARLKYPRR